MEQSETGLVGAGHVRIVEQLLQVLAQLQSGDGDSTRLVLLRGPSGVGKSRVVRELYQRLRDAQPDPGYWPPLIDSGTRPGAGVDPLATRKLLAPPADSFVWPAGALPAFSWWAFNCDRMPHGDAVDVIAQASPELRAHLVAVSLAWREAAGWGQKLKGKREQVIERGREALAEGGLEAAQQLLGAAVPGLGLAVRWIGRSITAARQRQEETELFDSEVQLGERASAERTSAAQTLAELLVRVSHPALPAIVVVEDIHLMGAELGELLNWLAEPRPGYPVLIVGTVWPEGEDNPVYTTWCADAQRQGRLQTLNMPELSTGELTVLLRRAAPRTVDEDAVRLVNRYRNPLALQLLLSLRKVQRRIERDGGQLLLTENELTDLPTTIRNMYAARWAELPASVQQSLMMAVGALPEPVRAPGVGPFLQEVVAAATATSRLLDRLSPSDVAQGLQQATSPHEWCVISHDLMLFREQVLADIAALNLVEQYDDEDVTALRCSTLVELSNWVDGRRGTGYRLDHNDPVEAAGSRWLWAMTTDADLVTPAVVTARITTAALHAAAYQYDFAIRLLASGSWCEELPPDHPDTLRTRSNLASWRGRAGRVEEAVQQFERLLLDQLRVLGPDHPDTLLTRNNLAGWLGEAGRVEAAVQQVEQLLTDQLRVLGPDHPHTLLNRNNLASWLGRAGRVEAAVQQFEQLLTDQLRVLGPDHPDTLATRNNLASSLGEAGRVEAAVQQVERLLPDQLRVLGSDHPDTLATRSNLASWLGRAGRVEAAVQQFELLLPDQLRVLGSHHPDTLTTRNNLASWLGEAGRVQEAVQQVELLLPDQLRVLGSDHPDTLATRNNLASWLGRAGRVQEAVQQFELLLPDQLRVFGPDHPDTLTTRNNLASWLGRAARVQEAVQQFELLLPDQLRVFGPDHPDTLATRSNLAFCLAEAGQVEEAVQQFEELLPDQLRVFDPDHPDTLRTRNNLASWLGEAGRVEEAVQHFERLLPDQLRVLGPDHPHTLLTRSNLASWLGEAGRVEEAVQQVELLLPDQLRVLGPDHPHTLLNRSNLAGWLGRAGRVQEAVQQFELLLTDQLRVLGPDHPDTLLTRNNLASWLGEAGRVEAAVQQFEQLLTDQLRVLGPDHPDTLTTRSNLAFWQERVQESDEPG